MMKDTLIKYITNIKYFLILGVVLIHSNFVNKVTDISKIGAQIANHISQNMMSVCVPCFFIISGFLFFNNVNTFSKEIYIKKLKSRVHTLLIPYVLWNIFCMGLFLFKVYYLHFPGLGIVTDGHIDWYLFFRGFFTIDTVDGFPYAFAFWFIRNLICFVIISPVVWVIARRIWLFAIALLVAYLFDFDTFKIEFFILGAVLAVNKIGLDRLIVNNRWFIILSILYFAMTFFVFSHNITLLITVILAMLIITKLGKIASETKSIFNNSLLLQATFFIYAFHQCFCTVVVKLWFNVCGGNNVFTTLIAYILSFVSMVAVSVGVYWLLRRLFPRFTAVITGGRG